MWWALLKNPKNILLLALAILLIVLAFYGQAQRLIAAKQKTTIASQTSEIQDLKEKQTALLAQVEAGKNQIIKLKKQQEASQKITDNTAVLMAEINKIKSQCIVEGEDAKIINSIFDYYSHGVRK